MSAAPVFTWRSNARTGTQREIVTPEGLPLRFTVASAGDRVMVLDCDLRRPTQHVQLGVPRDNGLTNYLAAPQGETDWSSYVKATEAPRR